MTRINGRALEDYKRFDIRETGLAVPGAESLYIPSVSNGFRQGEFVLDSNLVLYLPLYKLKGNAFNSVDQIKHSIAVIGALWKPNGRYFDGTDDYLTCGADASLDITTAITLMAWITLGAVSAYRDIIRRSASYILQLNNSNQLRFIVYKGSGTGVTIDHSNTNIAVIADVPCFFAASFDGEDFITSVNGANESTGSQSITIASNPETVLGIGSDALGEGNDMLGYIHEVWIYSRSMSLAEHTYQWNTTKWRYQ